MKNKIKKDNNRLRNIMINILRGFVFPLDLLLFLLSPISLIYFWGILFVLPLYFLIYFGLNSIIFIFLCLLLYFSFRIILKSKLSEFILMVMVLAIITAIGNVLNLFPYQQLVKHEGHFLLSFSFLSYLLGMVYAKLNYKLLNFIKKEKFKIVISVLLGISISGLLSFVMFASMQ